MVITSATATAVRVSETIAELGLDRSKAAAAASSSEGATAVAALLCCATQVATWAGKPSPMLAARARARAACLTYAALPPCSFPPWCARAARRRRGELGTHPEGEAAPAEGDAAATAEEAPAAEAEAAAAFA